MGGALYSITSEWCTAEGRWSSCLLPDPDAGCDAVTPPCDCQSGFIGWQYSFIATGTACNDACNAPDDCGTPAENAAAAGSALVFTSSVPWMVCGALYTSLHYFYPRDMERIFERRRLENEQAEAALNTELVSS